jgi:transcription elongation factor Elf1
MKSNQNKFTCDFCGHEERGKGYLQRHIDKKHRIFTCSVCNQSYKVKSNFISHLRAHIQRFVCQYCGEEINRLAKFQKHVYLKHEPDNKALILSVQSRERYDCVRSFPTIVHRNSHEATVHKGRREAAFQCTTCHQIFITKELLRLHSFDHFAGSLHFCSHPNCDRFFKNANQLQSHAKIHEAPNYSCDVSLIEFL